MYPHIKKEITKTKRHYILYLELKTLNVMYTLTEWEGDKCDTQTNRPSIPALA